MYSIFLYRCRLAGSCISVFCTDLVRVRELSDEGAVVSCKRVMMLGKEE